MPSAILPRHRVPHVLHDQPVTASRRKPAEYAAELATRFNTTASLERRRELAQFFTPLALGRFLASFARPSRTTRRILDAGAGTGVLACAVVERLPSGAGPVHLDAYEADETLAALCTEALNHARRWLAARGVVFTFTVHHTDFVLDNGTILDPHISQFLRPTLPDPYDLAISNPPYFKLQKQDPRAMAAAAIVYGQPNIYALFMAIMAGLLAERGAMVTITPRSFTTGDYFRRFRQHLFQTVTPEAVHLFDSRKDAFREDEVLQENVILRASRTQTRSSRVAISSSAALSDASIRRARRVPLDMVIDRASRDAVFHIPVDATDDTVIKFVRQWPNTLHRLGLEVSTGPVVAFRATEFLRSTPEGRVAPLLWLQHVRAMTIHWPADRKTKPQYIADAEESQYLLVPNRTYVVLRRFTAKEEHRRLTAAPLFGGDLTGTNVGLENHLNYIHRPKGELTRDEATGLAALLSSRLVDRYFRVSNGNTQVNAVELRALPLPSRELIARLGQEMELRCFSDTAIDDAVAKVLRVPSPLRKMLTANGYAEA